jgi:hypothetical protein
MAYLFYRKPRFPLQQVSLCTEHSRARSLAISDAVSRSLVSPSRRESWRWSSAASRTIVYPPQLGTASVGAALNSLDN